VSAIDLAAQRDLQAQVKDSSPACRQCAGLCCTVLTIHKSGEFSMDKPGGVACHNLTTDHACRVFGQLFDLGLSGCRSWSCFGAGQSITKRHLENGGSASGASTDPLIHRGLMPLRFIHLARLYLTEARARVRNRTLRDAAGDHLARYDDLASGDLEQIVALDSTREMRELTGFLLHCYRASVDRQQPSGAQAGNYADARPPGLRDTGLGAACFLGADLRGTDIRGADLSHSWYLTEQQLASARGSLATKLPPWLSHPQWWQAESA
jgi:hypothetical protein